MQRRGDWEKIVDWEPFCEQSEQNVSRAGLSEGLRERVIADFGLLITRTRIAHAPAAREVFTHYVRSNVEDF